MSPSELAAGFTEAVLLEAEDVIDRHHGSGYAKGNPILLASYMVTYALGYQANTLAEAIPEALDRLGNSLELSGDEINAGLDQVTASIGEGLLKNLRIDREEIAQAVRGLHE